MIITDLKEKLDNEFSKYYDVVLINGEWGIGKTYYLNSYLKDKKHIYSSLFGINSLDDFKLGIYCELNKSLARFKKVISSFSGRDIGIAVCSIPLPSIKFDIEKSIKKELKGNNIILVIDDLERKSENISIRELLGFIESLSQIRGIKIILVANENALTDDDKEVFVLFKEKVINKTYNIYKYSAEAVREISNKLLNENPIDEIIDNTSFLDVIVELISNHPIKNLRTLSKAILFSKIILSNINNANMTVNDKKEVILTSFAVVIEDNDQLYFRKKENDEQMDYCILKNYFKDSIFNGGRLNIIKPILNIYYDYNIEQNYSNIKDYYLVKHNINPEEKNIFYCSEEEVESRIKSFITNSIEKVNENLDINLWFKEFNIIYPWAEKIDKKELFKRNKIELIMDEYAKSVDINENLYEIIDRIMLFSIENKELQEYYKIYKNKISISYYTRLIEKIKNMIEENNYDITYLDNLFNIISNPMLLDETVIKNLVKLIIDNDFFIPNINGDILEKQWRWCHVMWEKCSNVEDKYSMRDSLYKFFQERINKYTKIGKYRIDVLNNQYHIHQTQSNEEK